MKRKNIHCRSFTLLGGEIPRAFCFWLTALVFTVLFILPTTALAYVGPGAGLTMIGSAVAMVLVLLVAMAGLIIWPLRVLRRRKREKLKNSHQQ